MTSAIGSLLASIPSPSQDSIEVGPLTLRAYGLMIALGVIAAVWLGQRRWRERGGDPDDVTTVALWAVPAGLIGARLYHVITDWKTFEGRWEDAFKIWEGGLGIPGGIAAGVLAAYIVMKRRDLSVPDMFDALVPSVPLAQAIGRWGNWFNQELYGEPTDLPWALEIDADVVAERTPQYVGETTFHPTFLYESLWNFALVGVLLWVDRKRVLKPGRLIGVYVVGYGLGRLWVELLRIDKASLILGVRVNVWVSLLAMVGGLLVIFWGGLRKDDPAPDPEPDAADQAEEVEP
ncbi:MAG: prolipoprotein diacylglyceryl transferase [Acidimicrobiia bacterium]|nr:prolipoprotein diacylglyceryl transferase [Acidimicrobiia bacterium]